MQPGASTHRKFAAIVFTDIVGFSRLAEKSEELALDLLEEHEGLVRRHLPAFAGREVKTIGDAFMLEFASAPDAVRCAIEIQKAMRGRNGDVGPDRRLLLRIGVHAGDVVERDGDLYGDGVNIAARVEPVSPHGGVAVSGQVRAMVAAELPEVVFEKLPARPLKNIERTIELFRVVMPWDGEAESAALAESAASADYAAEAAMDAQGGLSLADRWFGEDTADAATPEARATAAAAKACRVAIIPLVNASGEPEDEFISLGLSEELVTAVSCAGNLEVIGWDSMARQAGRGAEAAAVAAELRAGTIIRGRTAIAGGMAVFDLECLSGDGVTVHWSKHWEDDLRSMTRIYVDVARETARVAGVEVQEGEVSRIARLGTASAQAKILYLRASHSVKAEGTDEIQGARDRFMHAIELDGDYAFAQVGLARSFLTLGVSGRFPPTQLLMHIIPGALQAGRRAVECGRFLGETHGMLGLVRLGFTYDVAGAANELRQAIELKDGNAEGHLWYALSLAAMGRFDECDAELQRARELDPVCATVIEVAAFIWYAARRPDQAVPLAESGLGIHRHSWRLNALLGLARDAMGNSGGAVEALRRAGELSGFHPMVTGALGYVEARAGNTDAALSALKELDAMAERRVVPSWAAALVCAGLGDVDRAVARLQEAQDEQLNWLVFLNLTPMLDSVRRNPAYQALIERCGLVSLASTPV